MVYKQQPIYKCKRKIALNPIKKIQFYEMCQKSNDTLLLLIDFILLYILRFEDHVALDGGEDGLNTIKKILILAPQILINHG